MRLPGNTVELELTLVAIARARAVANHILNHRLLPAPIPAILNDVPDYAILPSVIQAAYALRWGELELLCRHALWTWEPQLLQPLKGSQPRILPSLPHPPDLAPMPELKNACLSTHGRQLVGHAVARTAERHGVRINRACANKTHLWRHLTAAAMILAGQSELDVQRALGHFKLTSTLYYLDTIDPASLVT